MTTASLPDEGDLLLGPITLPAGKRVHAGFAPAAPVAWVTSQAVPDAGRVWAALSSGHPEYGLIPFLLGALPGDPARPWDSEEFGDPADPAQLDHMHAAEILAGLWDGEMPSEGEEAQAGEPRSSMGARCAARSACQKRRKTHHARQ